MIFLVSFTAPKSAYFIASRFFLDIEEIGITKYGFVLSYPSKPSTSWQYAGILSSNPKCFPFLFPRENQAQEKLGRGAGDPFYHSRIYHVTLKEAAKHLMQIRQKDKDGKWYYPYAQHQKFMFWMYDIIKRKQCIKQTTTFWNRDENAKHINVEELQKQLIFLF